MRLPHSTPARAGPHGRLMLTVLGAGSGSRSPALVTALGLRFGDAFALSFQHQIPLERRDGPEHGQLAGGRAGIDLLATDTEHDQRHALCLQARDDGEQVCGGPGQPVRLAHDRGVALSDELDGGFQAVPAGDGGDPLGE